MTGIPLSNSKHTAHEVTILNHIKFIDLYTPRIHVLICSQGIHNLSEVLNLLIVAECVHAACLYAMMACLCAYDSVLQRKTRLSVGKKDGT